MEEIQVGIIGCGAIAKIRHLPECKENEQVSIFGVCDLNEDRLQRFSKAYKTKAFLDYREMLKCEELDAVIICLPHHLHATVAIDAANAGKHILVEKPIATSVSDANKMITCARENGVKLMVAHNQRFVPSHVRAKEWLDSGQLGKVYSFNSTFGHSGPELWSLDGEDSFYLHSENEIFGVLGDLAIHKVDLMQYLLTSNVSNVYAVSGTLAKNTSFEDNSLLIMEMENGSIGSITASWSYIKPDFSTVIHCEKGTIYLEDDASYPFKISYKDGTALHYEMPNILTYEKMNVGRSRVVHSFIQCILHNEEPAITGEEGLSALSSVLKAMEFNKSSHVPV